MKRCAIYTRTATPDSYPCESQRELCTAFAEQQGWAVLVEQFDDPVCSGVAALRSALARLLDRVRAGDVDVVLVGCTTRLSRSAEQLVALCHELRRHGAQVVSATQGDIGENVALLSSDHPAEQGP